MNTATGLRQVMTPDGLPLLLGGCIATGGQGAIHAIVDAPDLLAKLYHAAPDADQADKLRSMCAAIQPALGALGAWPINLLNDDTGGLAGFTMQRFAAFHPLHMAYDSGSRSSVFPNADWRWLVSLARRLAEVVQHVHALGHIIGDLNPNNVLVHADGRVVLVDCDSYQIRFGGVLHPCAVAMPEFCPPELHGAPLSTTARTRNHDCFSLAILIFHTLMLGRHPFAPAQTSAAEPASLTEQIARLAYGYATGAPDNAPDAAVFNQLPKPLHRAFHDAFRSEHKRPTARGWVDALVQLERQLVSCPQEPAHIHVTNASCPWCSMRDAAVQVFADQSHLPTAAETDLAAVVVRLRALQRDGGVPQPRNFPAPAASRPRRSVRIAALRARLPVIGRKAQRWLADEQKAAGQLALQWHQAQRNYAEVVQFKAARRALVEAGRRMEQWEAETNQARFRAARVTDARRRITRHLSRHSIVGSPLPGLDAKTAAWLSELDVNVAADLDQPRLDAIARRSPALALTLWQWFDALDRKVACTLDASDADLDKRRIHAERELMFAFERLRNEIGRATETERQAADAVLALHMHYNQVLAEHQLLGAPATS